MSEPTFFRITSFHSYLSPRFARFLLSKTEPVLGVADLRQIGSNKGLETPEALQMLVEIYSSLEPHLGQVLSLRVRDRKFLDDRVAACYKLNRDLGRSISDPDYLTVIGLEDGEGRVVLGPKSPNYCRPGKTPVAAIPHYLQGPHVTLFGPPDTAKMAINAMNSYHRKLKDEPAVIEELLSTLDASPKWGADDEDSKTPLRPDLVEAGVNLTGCFDKTLRLDERPQGKLYELLPDHLALPIKRFPGLALPCSFLFYGENPIPLHLYDFVLHLAANWSSPEALTFYVPKLENEEEAAYIHKMVSVAEQVIQRTHPEYKLGTVRLMIVLENPRAILRTHEIMDNLYPYFVGASLGWHDYLASTARLFKNDGNYRIPVKADPDIVIKYIKASHQLLSDVVGSRGGIQVGGMYGILPLDNDMKSESFQVTILGFVKDVMAQMKRKLTGFWVAHPDFVRLGLALVAGWKKHEAGDSEPLQSLIREILQSQYHAEAWAAVTSPDISGLNVDNPQYVRSLLVADIKESDFIANNHPDEIRYNVFQSLQYLTDWLRGNGCVALPAQVRGVPVRVMDDLATAERSRWEVWHELHHRRFELSEFIKIVHEEMHFIRKDLSNQKKIVQVKWDHETSKWYPVAMRIMIQLMTNPNPAEFATELLLPFTDEEIRNSPDPLGKIRELDPSAYELTPEVERLHKAFEVCGCLRWAVAMAQSSVLDLAHAREMAMTLTESEIYEAASFHGDIGENAKTLDALASQEQSLVTAAAGSVKETLKGDAQKYLQKFGFKFLVSAKGKTPEELHTILQSRLKNSRETEIQNARTALWEISEKRLLASPWDQIKNQIEDIRLSHRITGVSVAINSMISTQTLEFGSVGPSGLAVSANTHFQLASLSKTVATTFCLEYLSKRNISLQTPVNTLLTSYGSPFRISSPGHPEWAERVTIRHLMNHTALNLHYVHGFDSRKPMPDILDILNKKSNPAYETITVKNEPGTVFAYSGGGFLVLEHLIETLEGGGPTGQKNLRAQIAKFLEPYGADELRIFDDPPPLPIPPGSHHAQQSDAPAPQSRLATGILDSGQAVSGGHLNFPSFAAGGTGTPRGMGKFLTAFTAAFKELNGCQSISHDTAVQMVFASDRGCRDFMGCDMGLGVFVAEAGPNRFIVHQGANEGFRALFVQCFDGPDTGRGLVILCNADNRAVGAIAEIAHLILKHLKIQGVRSVTARSPSQGALRPGHFDFQNLPQEQIVNLGYKQLLFSLFEPRLPVAIERPQAKLPDSDQNLVLNATILRCSNQRFARAENLICPFEPVFDPELYCDQGKVMDSWESARHNPEPCDWLELQLKQKSRIGYVMLSTKYHDGNHPESVRLLGRSNANAPWREVLPKTILNGHSLFQTRLPIAIEGIDLVRVEMYPDGGLTRLGLYEDLKNAPALKNERFSDPIPKTRKPLTIHFHAKSQFEPTTRFNLASAAFGAKILRATNEHYGPASQVISPYPPLHMFDGLESARSRATNHHEEVLIELARPSVIGEITLDFQFFVNNNPNFVSIYGIMPGDPEDRRAPLCERDFVKPYAGNKKVYRVTVRQVFDRILVRTHPDGGINRIFVYPPRS